MNNSIISPEATIMADRLTERAFSVYLFLSTLPSPLAEFTFRQVIEDAYNSALILPTEIRIEKVIEGTCDAVNWESDSFDALLEYLGVSQSIDKEQIDFTIGRNSKEQLLDKMKALLHKRKELPPREGLMAAYANFSPDGFFGEESLVSYKGIIREKLVQVYDPVLLDNSSFALSSDPFEILGYKTFFFNWCADERQATHDKDSLFFRWYCDGDLLSLVFDVIFRGPVTAVSRAMWRHLIEKCESDYYLKDIAQKQYDEYRTFNPALPPYEFLYKGGDAPGAEGEESRYFPALPKIKISEENGYLTEQQLFNLYGQLLIRGYIDNIETPFDAFKRVFSGEGRIASPIKWNGQQKALASFLMRARKGVAKKDYAKTASQLFLQKNGKPCQVNTLNQPDYDLEPLFNEIFNNL